MRTLIAISHNLNDIDTVYTACMWDDCETQAWSSNISVRRSIGDDIPIHQAEIIRNIDGCHIYLYTMLNFTQMQSHPFLSLKFRPSSQNYINILTPRRTRNFIIMSRMYIHSTQQSLNHKKKRLVQMQSLSFSFLPGWYFWWSVKRYFLKKSYLWASGSSQFWVLPYPLK